MTQSVLVLSDPEVKALASPELLLQAARVALVAQATGGADVPLKSRLTLEQAGADVLVMPGYVRAENALGVKAIGGFPHNGQRGLHASPGSILLMNPVTGLADALVDATHLTDARTAAVTALACEQLATDDSETLAVIGAGGLARTHIPAIVNVLPAVSEVRVWSRNQERLTRFVDSVGRGLGARTVAARSAQACVEGADVIVTATTAMQPVISAAWLSRGATVCGVGSYLPGTAELDAATVSGADVVVVDDRRGVLGGPSDVSGPIAAGTLDAATVSEIGEIIARRRPGRTGNADVVVFKSVGSAAVDVVAAKLIVDAARDRGIGVAVPAAAASRG